MISTDASPRSAAKSRFVTVNAAAFPVVLFTFSMFLSAALLFVVEPMVGKMMMPLLGGTPAVWNTCLVFFQAVLLAGYLYAHAVLKFFGRRMQIAIHLVMVALPLLIVGLLPLHIPAGWEPPAESNPVGWVLLLLLVAVGLPFFALSATTSIMQRWFADSGMKDAGDPYFLYAASNAGSLVGLLAYPLLLEPLLRLHTQSRLWSVAYAVFVAFTAACAYLAWRWRFRNVDSRSDTLGENEAIATGVSEPTAWSTRWRWIALAFVPSSLMLGTTSAITADVPAIPLFWVLPLAVYLISLVLVFAKKPPISHRFVVERLPFLILGGLLPTVSQTRFSLAALLVVYLTVLLGLALVFHGELARSRPAVGHLTEFYLCLSVGGVLGGIFNSLIAPVVFNTVMELPLVLIFAALIRPLNEQDSSESSAVPAKGSAVWAMRKDWLLPLALGICMVAVILGLARTGIQPGHVERTLVFGYSMLWCLSFGKRRMRFTLGLVALLAASWLYAPYGQTLMARRSFFGVYRVRNSPDEKFRLLFHGGIAHGTQSLNPNASCEPLSYFTRSGPAGAIFESTQARMPNGDWAIIGLGAGAMASYLQPGQTLTYYEIDPLVVQIAEDPRYFTYLQRCAPTTRIVLGDARLKLREAPDGRYGLITLDAFSGDSIPMHLMTKEALALYSRKLAPGGIIAFHISNLYFDLAPTVGNLARDAHMTAFIANDTDVTQAQRDAGKLPSIWVVMARDPADLSALTADTSRAFRWQPLPGRPDAGLWTDDYSNLLGVVKSFTRLD
ncbi:MAG: spermidine synthase [Terracidiphilus sp.]